MLATPGPDLAYFTGYEPLAVNERMTLLREIGADLARLLREHGHARADFTVVGSGPNGARRLNAASRELRVVA